MNVFTDGALTWGRHVDFSIGGWAYWVHDGLLRFGNQVGTTNNRMELTAVLNALHDLQGYAYDDGELVIYTDSLYIVDCIADRWYEKWERDDWMKVEFNTKQVTPVKNRDLWEQILAIWREYEVPVSFRHIRGHGKNPNADPEHVHGNDMADKLAVQAKKMLLM